MEQPFFRRGGVKKLYNVIHDTKNPLNWFERMRQRQVARPAGLNANIGQVHRTIETREQVMVAKSGTGDQREVGKLAGMDSVKYYKERSGVLNLARSNPVLIKKIREASVPNNSPDAPPDASPEAVVAVVEGGDSGGGDDVMPSGLLVAPVLEGVEGEAEASSGGGAAASSSSTIVVPEKFTKYEAKITSIPKPTGGGYEEAVASGMSIEDRVVKYGPVPGADVRVLTAVALGDLPSNSYIATKARQYIENELGVKIGSREFFELLKYSATGNGEMSEAEYKEARRALEEAHPSYKEKVETGPKSKKELDAYLQVQRERAEKELADNILKVNEAVLFEKALEPIKSGDKTTIRTGFNSLFTEISKAVKMVLEKKPDQVVLFPNSLEIRKVSNADTIGRLYVDGVSISEYTTARKGDPELLTTIGSIEGIISVIRKQVLSGEEFEAQIQRIMLQEGMSELMGEDYVMNKTYPKLKSVFDSLEKQIDDSMKEFRPKGKGGRKPGSKNKKSKAVGALLSGGGGGGATSAASAPAEEGEGSGEEA